jgi:hypothetical protein
MSRRLFPTVVVSFMLLLVTASVLAALSFSSWAPAQSLESVPGTSAELNTASLDGCPILSVNGKYLYIASDRPGGLGGLDIWVAERKGRNGPFGAPVNMGAPINSAANDFCPSPQRSGRFLFVSDRPGGCGGGDIYLTRKHPVHANKWREPVNLGCTVNSPAGEAGPVILYGKRGQLTLFFSSNRPGGPGGSDLYMSQGDRRWAFAPAEIVPGVNSVADDARPSIRRDGKELFFDSTRPEGSLGGADIWNASRGSLSAPWSPPVNLGPNVNSAANETRASISWDGEMLLFGSTRPGVEGVSDVFYTTRDKLPNP